MAAEGTEPPMAAHVLDEEQERGDERAPRRWRRLAWLTGAALLPILLLVLWAVLFLPRDAAPTGGQVGAMAPELDLVGLDGEPVNLADYRGQPVLVNFWASWCGPCVAEFPLLQDAAQAHAADGLVIIGVVYRDNAQAAADFMTRMGADWATAMDPGEVAASEYGIIGPPETFFIGRDGVIGGHQIGQLTAADLERQLNEIVVEE